MTLAQGQALAVPLCRMEPHLKLADYGTAVHNAVVDLGIAFSQHSGGGDPSGKGSHDNDHGGSIAGLVIVGMAFAGCAVAARCAHISTL